MKINVIGEFLKIFTEKLDTIKEFAEDQQSINKSTFDHAVSTNTSIRNILKRLDALECLLEHKASVHRIDGKPN